MVLCRSFRCSSVLKVLVALRILCFSICISEAAAPASLYHICSNTTTYDAESTYKDNLNSVLTSLSSYDVTSNKLFYNETAGDRAPDRAYGLYMCRGDVTIAICHDCVVTAVREIVQKCPKEKEAYIWYDECMLRYNNESLFSTVDEAPRVYVWNTGNVTEPDRFKQTLGDVMDNLTSIASSDQSGNNGGKMKRFATGEREINNFIQLRALVQCIPDLSGPDCNRCLRTAIGELPRCCNGRPGGRLLMPSCNIRYEMYEFYLPPTVPPPPPPTPPPGGKGGIPARVIIAIVLAVVVSIFLFIIVSCFLRRRAIDARHETTDGDEILIAESLQYDLSTIGVATNHFSAENKIGEGGFGKVFKGVLPGGQEIAVKRLSKTSEQGVQEFKTEVVLVAKLQHRNLVRLVGFCLEQQEKILIYEFVPNKSLDYFLFDPKKRQLLDWSLRYKIINGIAQGILYLHEHSHLRVIHRDLKASNVLLDEEMNPKISDFGMARIVGESQTNTSRIMGTFGYMAPEYAMHGEFSVKSDVFSFGVLIIEIISGKKNNHFYQSGGSEDLLSYAWKNWKDRTLSNLVDQALGNSIIENEVSRSIHIGLLCVQEDPKERPTMTSVLLMLNNNSFSLPLPHQPAFFVRNRTEAMLKHFDLDSKSTYSRNQVSISELYPR